MEPGAANTWGAWNWNSTGATGYAFRQNGGAWGSSNSTSPTFRINGSPSRQPPALTPEVAESVPVSQVLLAVGCMSLYHMRKKNA